MKDSSRSGGCYKLTIDGRDDGVLTTFFCRRWRQLDFDLVARLFVHPSAGDFPSTGYVTACGNITHLVLPAATAAV